MAYSSLYHGMMIRRGLELLDYPTLATSKEGKTTLSLKVSSEMERIWVTNKHEVIRQVKVGRRWSIVDRYSLAEAHAAAVSVWEQHFKSRGCQFCQGAAREIQPRWLFCPHCGAPIRRRGRARRTPTDN